MYEPKEMVCNGCFRAFISTSHTFNSAEKELCPFCHSKDTTPILDVRVSSSKLGDYRFEEDGRVLS
jgi:rRNA maturation endonuclease Nob1